MMSSSRAYEVLRHATEASGPDFYRKLYGVRGERLSVSSREEWEALPLLTKEHLLERPMSDRSFLPPEGIDHVRATSGTSGRGALFCPRTPLRGMDYRLAYHDFKRPMLAFTVPAMPHWHESFMERSGGPTAVVYDPGNPDASVRIARDADVDSISVFAFHMLAIGESMKREGMGGRIRFIEMAGEACTRKLFEYLRETFPNAVILPFYGSSEVEDSPIGMPCRPITGEEPLSLYHGKESHYLEIVDPDTGKVLEPQEGAEGELVITAYPGEPCAFPLLRFRTGDMVRVISEKCPAHGSWSFTVLGRSGLDFIKVPGGVVRSDEIERVLRLFGDEVTDVYSLSVEERQTAQGPRLALRLLVEPKRPVRLEKFAEAVSREMRVSPHLTWAKGVEEGRFDPLVVGVLEPDGGQKKHRRIVRAPAV